MDRQHWNGHPDGRARAWVHDRWWLATVADPHGEPPAGEHPDDAKPDPRGQMLYRQDARP